MQLGLVGNVPNVSAPKGQGGGLLGRLLVSRHHINLVAQALVTVLKRWTKRRRNEGCVMVVPEGLTT